MPYVHLSRRIVRSDSLAPRAPGSAWLAVGPPLDSPLATMTGWRSNLRVDGGLTFGQNAIVVEGIVDELRVGAQASVEFAFAGESRG